MAGLLSACSPGEVLSLGLALVVSAGCGPVASGADGGPVPVASYRWSLPAGFTEPPVPELDPMSEAKVELGRHLFHDTRLSFNQTQACASCHQPALAFTDSKPKAIGSTGQVHKRGPLSLANAAWRATYNWSNSLLRTLEQQALVPLFNVDPIAELDMDNREDVLLARLEGDANYQALFAEAFPEHARPVMLSTVVYALSSFVRTIISGSSPYDRFINGDTTALSDAEKRGMSLFFGQAHCSQCHSGFTFSDAQYSPDMEPSDIPFHIEGLYNVDGKGGYPLSDLGLFIQTGNGADIGKFRTPTLRNIALTAPYMHDGSLPTLAEVIAHYADPFSLDEQGNHVAMNPRVDSRLRGIQLDASERSDLEAFLGALTDTEFLHNPKFASPFPP
jgi:cytochrome c peroxidase